MNDKLLNICKQVIQTVCPNAERITAPNIRGGQNNVLIANTPNETTVFKFGDEKLVKKNQAVSKLYKIRDIPAPTITADNVDNVYYEKYRILPGKTLFEAIQDGMTDEQIKQVYHEILVEFEKMSHISPAYINKHLTGAVHDIARINVSRANNKLLGQLCTVIVYFANIGKASEMALYHSDITPKNVIVSDDGHLVGFVDMDNVCICNKKHAFGMMAAKYHELGFDINELMDEYYKVSSEHLLRANIARRVTIANIGKRLLWKHSVRQTRQK